MSTTDLDEAERWSLVPFGDLSRRRGGVSGESGGMDEVTQRMPQNLNRNTFFSGEIISVNDRLTPEGCLRVIRNLWYHNDRLYLELHDHADELEPLSVGEDVLRGPIYDALPRGIQIEDEAWPLLFSVSRTMLSWKKTAWEQGWEATMPGEDMGSWAEELWGACGGIRDGD
ncbi:hypothetical protein G6011_00659 [Alternaria panax]|uniref:Uncharacterized protein n=1 Tax=Alternaria panax TaxID=48097 RepID=A0AAD4IJG6_9PLEO|nr:hypothetical protein G6011_00659 [Alternaria panax]